MTRYDYNKEYLSKEVKNARDNNYFGRIESFYRKLPKTECEKCGICCCDPPTSTFVEFLFAYELYDSFEKDIKRDILIRALNRYVYSVVDKFSNSCCFLDDNNLCLIYQRSCLSCKRWGTYGRAQYEQNWVADSEYNKKYQDFYKNEYNIVISDDNINARLPFCDKVKVLKNTYHIQESDYKDYIKSLYNVEIKCLQHANINQTNEWSINEWLVLFTFGKEIFDTRIELIQKLQTGNNEAIDIFIKEFNFDNYL